MIEACFCLSTTIIPKGVTSKDIPIASSMNFSNRINTKFALNQGPLERCDGNNNVSYKDLGLNSEELIIYNRLILSTYYNQENNDRRLFSFLLLDWVFLQRIGNRLATDYFSSMHCLEYTGRALMENRYQISACKNDINVDRDG